MEEPFNLASVGAELPPLDLDDATKEEIKKIVAVCGFNFLEDTYVVYLKFKKGQRLPPNVLDQMEPVWFIVNKGWLFTAEGKKAGRLNEFLNFVRSKRGEV